MQITVTIQENSQSGFQKKKTLEFCPKLSMPQESKIPIFLLLLSILHVSIATIQKPSPEEFRRKKKADCNLQFVKKETWSDKASRTRACFALGKGEAARFQSIITGSADVIDGRALRRSDFPFPVAIGHVPATDQPSRSIDTDLSLSLSLPLSLSSEPEHSR